MRNKKVFLLCAILALFLVACGNDNNNNTTEGESGPTVVSVDPYSVPSEGEKVISNDGIVDTFPKDQLIPEGSEIITQGTQYNGDKAVSTVVLKSKMTLEELTTFYNSAYESLGIESVDFSDMETMLSFSGKIEDSTQLDVSVMPSGEEGVYTISISYYLSE